jgi:flagellar protein FlaG
MAGLYQEKEMQMDVSNLTPVSQQVVPVAKAGGDTGTQKAAPRGNSLPQVKQRNPLSVDKSQKQSSAPQQNQDALHDLVAKANELPVVRSSDLKFTVAEGSDIPVIRVEDSKTGELIRQIPSEEMVAISRALEEQMQGMMLKEKV